jgi:hypothetical protein
VVDAGVQAELRERPRIDEHRDPLARGELARRVLARDLLLATAHPGLLAARVKVLFLGHSLESSGALRLGSCDSRA